MLPRWLGSNGINFSWRTRSPCLMGVIRVDNWYHAEWRPSTQKMTGRVFGPVPDSRVLDQSLSASSSSYSMICYQLRRDSQELVNGICKLCVANAQEDLLHALVRCPANNGIRWSCSTLPALELAVAWILAVAWSSLWESRKLGRRPDLYKVRADLEAKVSLLRETRHSEAAEQISLMISKL